ncbi:MAG: HD domain-containing protein [archaeon]
MDDLEDMVERTFDELGTKELPRNFLMANLNALKAKDLATYAHSVRVGLLMRRIAKHLHLDEKLAFYSGLSHDFGKLGVDLVSLTKTEGFDEKDMEEMKMHPEIGYRILSGVLEYTAEVIVTHHRHQKDGYPEILPESKMNLSDNSKLMINYTSRMLALADSYDAASTRKNDKTDGKILSTEEVKKLMLDNNPDQRHLIEYLYLNGIFGDGEGKVLAPDYQGWIYDSIWKDWSGERTPRETRRHLSLACAMEPLSEKTGCTSRLTNISNYLKLEYFITGGINIGDAFEDLALKINEEGKQPETIYNFAYKAQQDCKKNRAGGRINQGIIEMFVPIVTAQMLYDKNYELSVEEILEKAVDVMKNTSEDDVKKLVRMKELSYVLCEYYDRRVPRHSDAKNVFDYYSLDLKNSVGSTSIKHNEEFVKGFPSIKSIYNSIMSSDKTDLSSKVEEAYSKVRRDNHSEASVGLTADCVAVGIYLVLSQHPKEKIIV